MEEKIEEFNPLTFEKKLTQLKDTQESIQCMSTWCLQRRGNHKKIVASWLNVLKRVKVEQRLTLFYLANDVIQYSKRRNYEFVESWGTTLQKATPLVRDDKVKHKILRIFKIWEQRQVYDEEFLTDLTGLLSAAAGKKAPDDDPNDFQPMQLVNKIRQCTVLEADTDLRLKYIHDSHLQLTDADALCATLKERPLTDDVDKELGEGVECVERYAAALQREIVARETLCALLATAHQYYATQRGEVKVVANAYKNFGARVRSLKRRLDELAPRLPRQRMSSPTTPPLDAPSPQPDEPGVELELPGGDEEAVGDGREDDQEGAGDSSYNIDKTFSTSINMDSNMYAAGFSSFIGSDNNPFSFFQDVGESNKDKGGNKIEVISSEKQEFNINDFLKSLIPGNDSESNDGTEAIPFPGSNLNPLLGAGATDTLPGLDLLTPESVGTVVEQIIAPVPPPTSFYGSRVTVGREEPVQELYPSDTLQEARWDPSNWDLTVRPTPPPPPAAPSSIPIPIPTPARTLYPDTPESPPATERRGGAPARPDVPPPPVDVDQRVLLSTIVFQETDVDHRTLMPALAPPPPPPMIPGLSMTDDIDHRLLPPLAMQTPPANMDARSRITHKDIDHRNLISLTTPQTTQEPQRLADPDYRLPPPPLPPMVPPPADIVESVDMDLSEDEDIQMLPDMMYQQLPMQNQMPPTQTMSRYSIPPPYNYPPTRMTEESDNKRPLHRSFSNNNKVLVGGDNGARNDYHSQLQEPVQSSRNSNLIRINSVPNNNFEKKTLKPQHQSAPEQSKPASAPIMFDIQKESPLTVLNNITPIDFGISSNDMSGDEIVPKLSNPFDKMPNSLKISIEAGATPTRDETSLSNLDSKSMPDLDSIEDQIRKMTESGSTENLLAEDESNNRVNEQNLALEDILRNPSPPDNPTEKEWIKNEEIWSNPPPSNQMEKEWIKNEEIWSNPPPNRNVFAPRGAPPVRHFHRPPRPPMNQRHFMPQMRPEFWPRNGPRPPIRGPWRHQRPPRGYW